ncbi:hypothetical protein AVEN_102451-1 [Araneus ventricosus]|uniref:Uncharacterized protein n=1 Tax=Araneus ventricosus TaxID=182803 RepID=A0A4Y2WB56_ARAVE|nr:hypothetical protein AVEN_102451-1 [Araneus ventricosus]
MEADKPDQQKWKLVKLDWSRNGSWARDYRNKMRSGQREIKSWKILNSSVSGRENTPRRNPNVTVEVHKKCTQRGVPKDCLNQENQQMAVLRAREGCSLWNRAPEEGPIVSLA